jgi:hypothetical protein
MTETFAPFSGCIYCGSVEFVIGPRGGASLNVACDHCGARFNILDHPAAPRLLVNVLAGPPTSYAIAGRSITCRLCGLTSHNPNDIRERYCGRCHIFHDDLRNAPGTGIC